MSPAAIDELLRNMDADASAWSKDYGIPINLNDKRFNDLRAIIRQWLEGSQNDE